MNPNNKIPNQLKKIYLMAICGTGMGSLAGLLKQKGYDVSGSDNNIYPPMSTELQNQNIPMYSPYSAENLKNVKPDLVIVGNAISKTNPEAQFLLKSDIPYASMPQALNHFFLAGKDVIVISGTHGKTTTTSLMAHLLSELGADPSFMVGGVTKNFSKNFRIGSGKYFVIEGDEYDTAFFDKGPKFLHYNPKHVVITSLEFDHADIYNNLEQIKESFRKLVRIIPQGGSLHYCDEYSELESILSADHNSFPFFCRSYGSKSKNWKLTNFSAGENGSEFDILRPNHTALHIKSPMTGVYNAQNVAACFSVLEQMGYDLNLAAKALLNFKGVKRRQEILYQDKNYVIIDDFAHHPTAVSQTIFAIKEKFPKHYLLAVFEPRSNTSRRNIFQHEYAQSFLNADEAILAKVNQPEKVQDGQILDVKKIVDDLLIHNKKATSPKDTQGIINTILQNKNKPLAILIMSNGSFDNIHQKLIHQIKAAH